MLADLDTFFVEVERIHRPELRGIPVVIGGPPDQRGVVAACSYEARRFGIKSAMPMGTAYQLAHKARAFHATAWLHSDLHGQYSLYSRRVQDILRDSVPVFEARSIDEFAMDISGCERLFAKLYGGIDEFAHHLRRRVRGEVGLPLSIGLGPSRIVAKMASRHAKPDGIHHVQPENVQAFLEPHDIQAVPGIGPVTSERLRNLGIARVEQLLAMPRVMLRAVLGEGFVGLVDTLLDLGGAGVPARDLLDENGGHGGPPHRIPKTIGHETTFERDLLDPALLEEMLWTLTEDACRRLRDKNLIAKHVTVKLRYSDFKTHTHGGFFEQATDVDTEVFAKVKELFWRAHRRLRVRLVGVRLDRLAAGGNQPGLFDSARHTREVNLIHAVDRVRTKYGRYSLLAGPGVWRIAHEKVQANATAGIPSAFLPG
jgi:DNA polymerase-4